MKNADNWKKGGILAAFIAAVAVFLVMLQVEKNMLAGYEKGSVLVADVKLYRGQQILKQELEASISTNQMDINLIPDTALIYPEELEGKIPLYNVEEGTILTAGMFTDVDTITKGMKDPVVAGLKADDLFQVAGGVLREGDRIHVYRVEEDKVVGQGWENLWVQSVFDQGGNRILREDQNSAAQRINVYLDKSQVEDFYTQLKTGNLRAVKICD